MNPTITALGARSPAGLTAEQTALGIRASHLSPQRTKFEGAHREPVGMSILGALPDALEGGARMVALAGPALAECAAGHARAGRPAARPVVLLACPSPRPGFAAEDASELLRGTVREAGLDACPDRSAAFAVGHAGFALAMERALGVLAADREAVVFVGGVDSAHDEAAVAHLEAELRLHSARNPGGFLPAEGAGFLALSRGDASPFGEAVFAGTDVESTLTEGTPNLARAATELAVRAAEALGLREDAPLGWYLRTTNRERHRAREDEFVTTRLPELLDPDATRLDELAEHLGDAGAASGALLAVYVCQGFASGYAPSPRAAIALSSDGPERGIVALRRRG